MNNRTQRRLRVCLHAFSNLMFTFLGVALSLVACAVAVSTTIRALKDFDYRSCDTLVGYVSYLIIAVAIFDVGRYLIEEEVLRERELRSPREARQSITKFMVIIVIAVTLEALLHLLTVHNNLTALVYPSALLLVAALLLVGLGVFQRLSAQTEKDVEKFRTNAHGPIRRPKTIESDSTAGSLFVN